MQSLNDLLITRFVEKNDKKKATLKVGNKTLKFYNPDTLFDLPLKEALDQKRCPICSCNLYEMKNKKFWYCKSVKHKRRFIVSSDKIK